MYGKTNFILWTLEKINNLSVDCDFWSRVSLNVLLEKRSLNLFNENYPVIDDFTW
jgi:hypothetical protein